MGAQAVAPAQSALLQQNATHVPGDPVHTEPGAQNGPSFALQPPPN
jgi:hypothetical protein